MKGFVFNLRKNYLFLILFMFPLLNMLYMHYQFFFSIGIDFYFSKTSILDNFFAVLLDVTAVFLLSLLLSWGRVKTSLTVTFFITLILSFSNIIYSRFFGQYLSFSAIGQAGNINDNVVIQSILSEIKAYDLVHVLLLILFVLILILYRNKRIHTNVSLYILGVIWTLVLTLLVVSHSIYLVSGSYERAIQTIIPSYSGNSEHPNWKSVYPNWATFHEGLLRSIVFDHIFSGGKVTELGTTEMKAIEEEYMNHEKRVTGKTLDNGIQNVIFIIVESYLSVLTDLKIDGKEITPYLNQLKRDSNVYYNGHVRPNATIGRSSDGQLIYMTGLLPLRTEVTVGIAKNDRFVGLPYLLHKHGLVNYSQILIPTNASLWEQNAMNEVYHIRTMYSRNDYSKNLTGDDLTDEEIFDFAKILDARMPSNSFSLILTLSMHEPFDECVEHGFHLNNCSLPNRYRNYLITSHYFDEQIGKYIEHLKADGLYEKSLIVIAADHEPHLKNMDIEGEVSDELPLFIVNGGFDKNRAWSGDCNQLDVYTTLLDIIGVESEWRGLGHTLLNPNYSNSVSDKTWQLSEWIINGDYFRKKKQ